MVGGGELRPMRCEKVLTEMKKNAFRLTFNVNCSGQK
jgi:hypothetical protein